MLGPGIPPSAKEPTTTTLLEFSSVEVHHDGRTILGPLDLAVPAAGITVLQGESGAGKTTLLRLCNGLEVPSVGVVSYFGEDLRRIDVLRLRREVGMVFQTPALFGGSVADNLAVAAPGLDEARYAQILERVALHPDFLHRQAASLSGGEAQRMCLARTLITRPTALLLDEPTSALDESPKLAFEQTALELSAQGLPILWVTHEAAQATRVADRVVRLADGLISGPPESGTEDGNGWSEDPGTQGQGGSDGR